jgi:hypothetical protein
MLMSKIYWKRVNLLFKIIIMKVLKLLKQKFNITYVNRGTPRTPRQHRVGDLGGTRREPTAHDGSRTYRAGSTGRYESTSKGSTLVSSRGGIKTPCFETICFINLPLITNPANIRSGIKDPNKWCSGNSSCSD